MDGPLLSRLGWPARLGGPGAVALAALALALLLAARISPQWQVEADAGNAEVQAARATATRAQHSAPSVPPPRVPEAGDPAERAADLLALAVRHGLRVGRTQQRLERQGPVQRLALSQSVQGRYADLRAYLGAALRADPALALDRLQWRRATPAAADLEAELQWSVLQPWPPSASPPPSTPGATP